MGFGQLCLWIYDLRIEGEKVETGTGDRILGIWIWNWDWQVGIVKLWLRIGGKRWIFGIGNYKIGIENWDLEFRNQEVVARRLGCEMWNWSWELEILQFQSKIWRWGFGGGPWGEGLRLDLAINVAHCRKSQIALAPFNSQGNHLIDVEPCRWLPIPLPQKFTYNCQAFVKERESRLLICTTVAEKFDSPWPSLISWWFTHIRSNSSSSNTKFLNNEEPRMSYTWPDYCLCYGQPQNQMCSQVNRWTCMTTGCTNGICWTLRLYLQPCIPRRKKKCSSSSYFLIAGTGEYFLGNRLLNCLEASEKSP